MKNHQQPQITGREELSVTGPDPLSNAKASHLEVSVPPTQTLSLKDSASLNIDTADSSESNSAAASASLSPAASGGAISPELIETVTKFGIEGVFLVERTESSFSVIPITDESRVLIEGRHLVRGLHMVELQPEESPDEISESTRLLFCDAVEAGRIEDVLFLGLICPDLLHDADADGWNSLHAAVYYNHLPLVKVLLENKVRTDRADDFGHYPLYYAASEERAEVCLYLLEFMAAEQGFAPGSNIAKTYQQLVDDEDITGADELIIAGYRVDEPDANGATALHYAARARNDRLVQQLLAWNAEPNAQDKAGNTPLHWAVKSLGQIDENGVDGDQSASGLETVEVEAGAQPDDWRDIMRRLIEEDGDTELRNHQGQTAYDLAEATNQYEVMDWIGGR